MKLSANSLKLIELATDQLPNDLEIPKDWFEKDITTLEHYLTKKNSLGWRSRLQVRLILLGPRNEKLNLPATMTYNEALEVCKFLSAIEWKYSYLYHPREDELRLQFVLKKYLGTFEWEPAAWTDLSKYSWNISGVYDLSREKVDNRESFYAAIRSIVSMCTADAEQVSSYRHTPYEQEGRCQCSICLDESLLDRYMRRNDTAQDSTRSNRGY